MIVPPYLVHEVFVPVSKPGFFTALTSLGTFTVNCLVSDALPTVIVAVRLTFALWVVDLVTTPAELISSGWFELHETVDPKIPVTGKSLITLFGTVSAAFA